MLASVIVNPDILELYPSDTVSQALKAMDKYLVRHLPVVENGKLQGIISRDDIESHQGDKKLEKLSTHFIEARLLAQMHYFECFKVFAKTNLTVLPIVDPDGIFIGAVTPRDLSRYIAENSGIDEMGAIIVLTMPPRDYSLLHLAQMVEGNDAHILTAVTKPRSHKNELEVTLKLNTTQIGGVLQTLNRYGYTVLATFDKNNDHDFLNDRYEALLKYLNM